MLRAANRTPPTNSSVSRKYSATTPVGAVTATSPVGVLIVVGWRTAMNPTSASVATTIAWRIAR